MVPRYTETAKFPTRMVDNSENCNSQGTNWGKLQWKEEISEPIVVQGP